MCILGYCSGLNITQKLIHVNITMTVHRTWCEYEFIFVYYVNCNEMCAHDVECGGLKI